MAIKILHVGIGIRGRHWLDFVAQYPEASSVACVDPDREALEHAKKFCGEQLRTFSDLGEALGSVEADAALIASPSFLHADQAVQALEAGLAVMIEKPFACDVREAQRVIEKGESCGRPVMVAENFRYVPAERTVRKVVREGLLGQVFNVSFADRRRMPSDTQGPWMQKLDHPQLQEIAVHHFDSLRSFFGKRPVSVAARTWNPPASDYARGACTEALIELEDDLHVQYVGTLTSQKFLYRLWIEGELGELWTNRKLVLWRQRGKKLFRPLRRVHVPKGDEAPYPREGTTSLLDSLRAAVERNEPPETNGRENIWAIAMMQAGVVSDKERRSVDIGELYRDGSAQGA